MSRLALAALATLAPALATAYGDEGSASSAAAGGPGRWRFQVRVENVSTAQTLKLSNGRTAPAPNAPVLWFTHTRPGVLFTPGHYDHGVGLEALAEDGDPGPLARHLAAGGEKGVVSSGAAAVPAGDSKPGPATPGKRFEFSFDAAPGERLTIASMFGQSNDVWIGTDDEGLNLFGADGRPLAGDVTGQLYMWDAGTELNEEPGLGPNQAPRQKAPNTGIDEHERIRRIGPKDGYPAIAEVVRVTVTAAAVAAR